MSGTTTFTNVWLRTETRMAVTTTTRSSRVPPDRSCVIAASSAFTPPPRRTRKPRPSPQHPWRAHRGWSGYRAACRLPQLLSNKVLDRPKSHHLQNTLCPKVLLPDPESAVQVVLYPIQQSSKCLAVPGVHAGEHGLLGPLPAAQDGLFEGPTPPGEVDAEAPGVLLVGPALHEAAGLQAPQHLGDGGGFDAEPVGEIPAAKPVVLPELDEHHLLADVQPVPGQQLPDVGPVRSADFRQGEARVLPYRMDPGGHRTRLRHQPTDLLFGLKALESIPQLTMRRGWIRIISPAKSFMIFFPPSERTSALPRTSTPRTRHGGSTSSTTNAALPVLPTSLNFLLPAKLCPPMSTASRSSLYLNATGTTCGFPSASTVARRPSRCLFIYSISMSVNALMPRSPFAPSTARSFFWTTPARPQ